MNPVLCEKCQTAAGSLDFFCSNCGAVLPRGHLTFTCEGSDEGPFQSVTWQTLEATNADPLDPGSRVGQFQILKKLAHGGMGVVYQARDLTLNRTLAVKVLRTGQDALEESRRLLLEEAQKASRLSHPNVVKIFNVARGEGLGFIAMELVKGAPLLEGVPKNGLPPDKVAHFMNQATEGLQHAHDQGIVHGDLKPSNLMVTDDGNLKILDFGLASVSDHPPLNGNAESIRGTPAYMSPEQISGKPIDAASDMFSLGLVCYFLLTGKHPFKTDSVEEVQKHITGADPPPLNHFNENLLPGWQTIIDRCLAKDKADRYPSMAQLGHAIKKVAPTHSSVPVQPRKSSSPNPFTLLFVTLAVMVFGGLGYLSFTPKAEPGVLSDLPQTRGLAVLPFENTTGDPLLQVFCDGLAASLSERFAHSSDHPSPAWIVPTTEIYRMKQSNPLSIHKKFGVDRVLSGQVSRDDKGTHLELELHDPGGEGILGEEKLLIPDEDLFATQHQVFEKASALLGWKIPPASKGADVAPALSGSYRDYLFGLGYLYRRNQEGNLDQAITSFQKALSKDPDYIPAKVGLAEAHILQWLVSDDPKWLEEGMTQIQGILKDHPFHSGSRVVLGKILTHRGNYQEALPAFQEAITLEPNNSAAGYGLARLYHLLNRPEEAEKLYLETLAKYPNDWVGHRDLGIFYFRRGHYGKAENRFRKLVALAPENNAGYYNLVGSLQAQGKTAEALAISRQSLQVQPTVWAYSNMGTALFYQGKFEEAATLFEKAANMRPSHYLLWGNLADAYRWSSGAEEKALETYQRAIGLVRKALAVNADDPYHQSSLLLYLVKSGQKEKAHALLENTKIPTDTQLIFELAQVYELMGERDQAFTYLQQALDGNFGLENIVSDPELADLRKDVRFTAMLERQQEKGRASGSK